MKKKTQPRAFDKAAAAKYDTPRDRTRARIGAAKALRDRAIAAFEDDRDIPGGVECLDGGSDALYVNDWRGDWGTKDRNYLLPYVETAAGTIQFGVPIGPLTLEYVPIARPDVSAAARPGVETMPLGAPIMLDPFHVELEDAEVIRKRRLADTARRGPATVERGPGGSITISIPSDKTIATVKAKARAALDKATASSQTPPDEENIRGEWYAVAKRQGVSWETFRRSRGL